MRTLAQVQALDDALAAWKRYQQQIPLEKLEREPLSISQRVLP